MDQKQPPGKTSNPPHTTKDQFTLILEALRDSNRRQESLSSWQENHEARMNASDLCLTSLTERFDRFFNMWLAK